MCIHAYVCVSVCAVCSCAWALSRVCVGQWCRVHSSTTPDLPQNNWTICPIYVFKLDLFLCILFPRHLFTIFFFFLLFSILTLNNFFWGVRSRTLRCLNSKIVLLLSFPPSLFLCAFFILSSFLISLPPSLLPCFLFFLLSFYLYFSLCLVAVLWKEYNFKLHQGC